MIEAWQRKPGKSFLLRLSKNILIYTDFSKLVKHVGFLLIYNIQACLKGHVIIARKDFLKFTCHEIDL